MVVDVVLIELILKKLFDFGVVTSVFYVNKKLYVYGFLVVGEV